MSRYTVTLNSDVVVPPRRIEAEEIVRSYFPYADTLAFDYIKYPWPIAIMEFPKEAFAVLDEPGTIPSARGPNPAGRQKHPGDLIQDHVEAELKEMLATRPARRARSSWVAA